MAKSVKSVVTLSKPVFVEGKLIKAGTKVLAEEFEDEFYISEVADDYVLPEEDEMGMDEPLCAEDEFFEDDELEFLRARRMNRIKQLTDKGDDPEGEGDAAEGKDDDKVAGTEIDALRRLTDKGDDPEGEGDAAEGKDDDKVAGTEIDALKKAEGEEIEEDEEEKLLNRLFQIHAAKKAKKAEDDNEDKKDDEEAKKAEGEDVDDEEEKALRRFRRLKNLRQGK